MLSDRRGVALLEVLVALAILATAGTGLVILVTDQVRAVWEVQRRVRDQHGAEEVLALLSLRDARGLDLRLGRRTVGGFVTDVQRPRPGLYRLAVADDDAPDGELLVTIVHRSEVH